MIMNALKVSFLLFMAVVTLHSCSEDDSIVVYNPDTAQKASIDRFSADAGTLFVRDATNGMPAANAPINFDAAPFITKGYGPSGSVVEYYNFDVQSTVSAPIYVFFHENGNMVNGQLNIIDVVPGDAGYNDFWQVVKVIVPDDYSANSVNSLSLIQSNGYSLESTDMIVNCPVVPEGSTATKRLNGESNALVRSWYKGQVVFYFTFSEKALALSGGAVPVSPIYVTFNINPNEPNGGPPSGFVTEAGSDQTHNVLATLPADAGYSPLWSVNIYDNMDFANVADLASAEMASLLASGAALVNCPVVAQ
jgi:hypothetical protein